MAYKMGPGSASEYIDEFWKYLVDFDNISKAEAKFIFEINLADRLSALVLPYNCADLYEMILYTR